MKKWIFCILALCVSPLLVIGNQLADSIELKKQLTYLDELITRDYDSSLIVGNWIANEAKKQNLKHIQWEAMLYQGKAYGGSVNKDSSLIVLNEVLAQATSLQDRIFQIKARIELSNTYQIYYQFIKSIENLIEAEKLLENSDPFELRFDILDRMAITHRKMKDYDSAIEIFNSILNNFYFQLDTVQKFLTINNLGVIQAMLKNYGEAENYFNDANEVIKNVDDPVNQARINYNLGALYVRQKKYKKAEKYITKTLDEYTKISDKNGIENCFRVLGAIQMDLKNYSKAEEFHLNALKFAKEVDNPKAILGNYKNLYITYGNQFIESGDVNLMNKELEYFKKWAFLKDSIYEIEMASKILELEKVYETEKKNNQIALLMKDNQIKEDDIKIQQTQRNSLLIFIILVLGVLGFFIYAFNYNKKITRVLQKQSKRIIVQNDEIFNKNRKLQKAIDTRNKLFSIIAHDLRSPLTSIANFSRLIGFYLHDNRLEDLKIVAKELEHKNNYVLELTDNLLSWTKSQSEDLRPQFEKVSIKELIEECLDIYKSVSSDKQIDLCFDDQEDHLIWADRNMAKTIIRNLINNAIKFTPNGGRVCVSYLLKDGFVELCIADNGIGMSTAQADQLFKTDKKVIKKGTSGEKSTGLGLSVCQEFTLALGGTIQAKSLEHNGSQFLASFLSFENRYVKKDAKNTEAYEFSNSLN